MTRINNGPNTGVDKGLGKKIISLIANVLGGILGLFALLHLYTWATGRHVELPDIIDAEYGFFAVCMYFLLPVVAIINISSKKVLMTITGAVYLILWIGVVGYYVVSYN